jgi:transposase
MSKSESANRDVILTRGVSNYVEAIFEPGRSRVDIRTGVGRRRRWTEEDEGRIVAEAVARGAVISEVARRHELTPQHLFTWIRAAKDGNLALQTDNVPAFVPVVPAEAASANKIPSRERAASIEITVGAIKVRVRNGADARTVEAFLRAVRRAAT